MKPIIFTILALASLGSLSACSGQAQLNSAYPVAELNTHSQNFAAPMPAQQTHLSLGQPAALPTTATEARPQITQPQSPALRRQTVTLPGARAATDASPVNRPAIAAASQAALPLATQPSAVQPQPVPQLSVAEQLLAQAVARFESLESFKISVEGFETVTGKSPSRLSFNMYALNEQAKIEVLKHTNSLYVGVKMGYRSGADAISVRPGGLLGFVKVDTKLDDERLSTPRGYRLDQIDAFAISRRLLNGPHQPKILGKTELNGRQVAILEYTQANDYDARITRELLAIDMEDHFIRMHEMYEGPTLVFSLKLSNIQLNVPVSSAELGV